MRDIKLTWNVENGDLQRSLDIWRAMNKEIDKAASKMDEANAKMKANIALQQEANAQKMQARTAAQNQKMQQQAAAASAASAASDARHQQRMQHNDLQNQQRAFQNQTRTAQQAAAHQATFTSRAAHQQAARETAHQQRMQHQQASFQQRQNQSNQRAAARAGGGGGGTGGGGGGRFGGGGGGRFGLGGLGNMGGAAGAAAAGLSGLGISVGALGKGFGALGSLAMTALTGIAAAAEKVAGVVGDIAKKIGEDVWKSASAEQGFAGRLSVLYTQVTKEKVTEMPKAIEMAKQAMLALNRIAAATPFSVKELTEGYIKLASRGLAPTEKQLIALGDIASMSGKKFTQLAEAILDAQMGERERLKEFGVVMEDEGNKIKLSIGSIKAEGKTVMEAFEKLGSQQGITGAMMVASQTWGGMFSTLKDTWDQVMAKIGSTPAVFDAVKTALAIITSALEALRNVWIPFTNHLTEIFAPVMAQLEKIFSPLIGQFTEMGKNLEGVEERMLKTSAITQYFTALFVKAGEWIGEIVTELIPYIQDFISNIEEMWGKMDNSKALALVFNYLKEWIVDVVVTAMNLAEAIMDFFSSGTSAAEDYINGAIVIFDALWGLMKSTWEATVEIVGAVVKVIFGWIDALDKLGLNLGDIIDVVLAVAEVGWAFILMLLEIVNVIVLAVLGALSDLYYAITGQNEAVNEGKTALQKLSEIIRVVAVVLKWFTDIIAGSISFVRKFGAAIAVVGFAILALLNPIAAVVAALGYLLSLAYGAINATNSIKVPGTFNGGPLNPNAPPSLFGHTAPWSLAPGPTAPGIVVPPQAPGAIPPNWNSGGGAPKPKGAGGGKKGGGQSDAFAYDSNLENLRHAKANAALDTEERKTNEQKAAVAKKEYDELVLHKNNLLAIERKHGKLKKSDLINHQIELLKAKLDYEKKLRDINKAVGDEEMEDLEYAHKQKLDILAMEQDARREAIKEEAADKKWMNEVVNKKNALSNLEYIQKQIDAEAMLYNEKKDIIARTIEDQTEKEAALKKLDQDYYSTSQRLAEEDFKAKTALKQAEFDLIKHFKELAKKIDKEEQEMQISGWERIGLKGMADIKAAKMERAEKMEELNRERINADQISDPIERAAAHMKLDKLQAIIKKKFAQAMMQGIADAASQISGKILSTVSDIMQIQINLKDQQLAKLDQELEKLKEINEAEEKRTELMNAQQGIINTIAEQRIKELQQLSEGIPDAQKARVIADIELEQKRIKAIGDAKEAARVREEKGEKRIAREKKKIEEEKRQLQEKQFEINRAAKIIEITMSTAASIMRGFSDLGPLGGAIFAVVAGALGGVQIGIVASEPNPYKKFKKGTLSVTGGKANEDSVHALLTPGEAVIPVSQNQAYQESIAAIFNHSIPPEVLNGFVKSYKLRDMNFEKPIILNGNNEEADRKHTKEIVEAIKAKSNVTLGIDNDGFSAWVESENTRTKIRDSKLRIKI